MLFLLLKLRDVLLHALIRGLHGGLALMPVGRAHLPVLLHELERLDQPHGLVDVPAHREVVDRDLAEDPLGVDDEHPAERDPRVLDEHAVVAGHAEVLVREDGDVHLPEPALLAGGADPGKVGVLAVAGGGDDLAVDLAELVGLLAEGDDLGGADEGEVHGVEEEDKPLPLVVGELDVLEVVVDDGGAAEIGCGLTNKSFRHFFSFCLE